MPADPTPPPPPQAVSGPASQSSPQPAQSPVPSKPSFRLSRLFLLPFKSKLFALATLAVLFGAGTMIYNAAQAHNGGGGSMDNLAIDAAPWSLKAGVSFIAAFVFAFLLRLAIKMALLIGGTLIAGAMLLHWLGLGVSTEHVDALKEGLQHTTTAIKQQGDHMWEIAKTYLPSGTAAGAGLWKGARQDIT
jgi:uncharacterized membrane protein (Fun14 family)